MPRKAKYLTALMVPLALAIFAAPSQAQRGTVQIIQNQPSALVSPTSTAVNETTGDVYSLTYQGPVQVFDSEGNFLFKFESSFGRSFYIPAAIAIDQANGDVYVSDEEPVKGGSPQVEVFDAEGNFLTRFHTDGALGKLAVDPASGDVYITDRNALSVFNSSGDFVRISGWNVDATNPSTEFEVCTAASGHECQAGEWGSGAGQFGYRAGAVALDQATGEAYAVDPVNSRVEVFDSSGNYVSQFGSAGSGDGRFSNPTGIAFDQATEQVFVGDSGNDRVEIFEASGAYEAQFGAEGSGSGQFRGIAGIALDEAAGLIYAVDGPNYRIQALDTSGSFVLMFGQGVDQTTGADVCTAVSGDTCQGATNLSGLAGLAVDSASGDLYALNNGQVFVYSPAGEYLRRFGVPGGERGGDLERPNGIAFGPEGDVYVLESGNNRVSKFDAEGNFLLTFGWNVNFSQAGSAPEVCPRPGFPSDICQAGEEGTELGQIGGGLPQHTIGASAIAVDPTGKVLVGEPGRHSPGSSNPMEGNRRIQVFSSSGGVLSQFPIPHEPAGCTLTPGGNQCLENLEPVGIGADASFIYTIPTANQQPRRVKVFTPSGEPLGALAETQTFGQLAQIAVDQKQDHIYVYQASNPSEQQYEVAEYDPNGNLIEQIGLGLPKFIPAVSEPNGLAVRPGTARAYVSVNSRIFVLDTLTDLPTATISAPTAVTSNSVTFHGTASSHSETLGAGYHFEYRKQGETAWTPASEEDVSIGTGTGTVSATQSASGLEPNSKYEARLVVTRELGGGSAATSTVAFKTAPERPALSLIAPTRVTDTTATLQAQIDPRNSATQYHFEYGTDSGYGERVPVAADGSVGSGLGRVSVFEHISGLQPATTYHFRLVTDNEGGEESSADYSFTTRTSGEVNWPVRGIELVNPPDKGNQNAAIGAETSQPSVSPDGNRVLWKTFSGGPDSTTGAFVLHLSDFSPSGWISKTVIPPASEQVGGGDLYFSSRAVSADLSHYAFIGQTGFFDDNHPHYLVRTDDQAHMTVLADFGNHSPGATVISDDGNVLTDDPATGVLTDYRAGSAEAVETPSCGYTVPPGVDWFVHADASRLFLESPGSGVCGEPNGIYMLDRRTSPESITLVSGPQSSAARFLEMNPDGTDLLFTKGGDIYRWSEAEGDECLSCGSGFNIGGGLASPDLSHVYFCGPKPEGPVAEGKEVSCYIWVWKRSGIAYVAASGAPRMAPLDNKGTGIHTAEVSRDGTQLAFLSSLNGTTADETGADGTEASAERHAQIFHYDDRTGFTECISCRGVAGPQSGGMPGLIYKALAMSADGQTITFTTRAATLPEDINNAPDIYEWHNGVVRLVTDGESPFSNTGNPPYPWGLSDDGTSLIFSAGGVEITGHELDSYANVYDARAGGNGFPVELPPAHCTEDSCQGPLASPPEVTQPGSASLAGPGSVSATHQRRRHRKSRNHRRPHKAAHHRVRHGGRHKGVRRGGGHR